MQGEVWEDTGGDQFVFVGLLMGTELCCLALQLESPGDTQGLAC